MKNENRRNKHAIVAHFLKAGSHKDVKKDIKEERRRARKLEEDHDTGDTLDE